ncbi:hypothetical protein WN943_013740 [Citrus x changshan-huyou]
MAGATSPKPCVFCHIARNSTSTPLLHSDEKVVAFQDIKPAAYRHYLVISVDHIPTVRDLQRRAEDYSLVRHMLNVGQELLQQDAPQSNQYRYCLLCMNVWQSSFCLCNFLSLIRIGLKKVLVNQIASANC